MKKVLSALIAILLVAAMAVSAFAEAVPSPSVVPVTVTETTAVNAQGEAVEIAADAVVVNVVNNTADLPEEEQEVVEAAFTALTEAASLEEIIPECAGMEVVEVMNVTVTDDVAVAMEEGTVVSVTVEMDLEAEAGTILQIIRFVDGEWVLTEDYAEVMEDGTVVLHLSAPGPIALVFG